MLGIWVYMQRRPRYKNVEAQTVDKPYFGILAFSQKKGGETYEKEMQETPQEFQWLIAVLLKLDGIEIKIIGCFVWITGDTKPHKERLKALGFRWHSKKHCWYKSPDGYRRWGKGEYTMDEIRGMYPSMKINKNQQQ